MDETKRESFYLEKDLQNSFSSHNLLCKLAYDLNDTTASKISIRLDNVNFIASNLFSVLGCIFTNFTQTHPEADALFISGIKSSILDTTRKNGFCEHLGFKKIPDIHNTVIPYKRFNVDEIDEYERYLTLNLFTRKDLPQMSQAVSDSIRDYLLELFKNVMDHTSSKYIFTCGQYFPKSYILYFTIVDMGETIPYNVHMYHSSHNLSQPSNPLDWAIMDGNTTSVGNGPRGIGLTIIRDFIHLNKGSFYIVSGEDTFEIKEGKERFKKLAYPFPGTFVTVGFNLRDNFSYTLASEENITIQF